MGYSDLSDAMEERFQRRISIGWRAKECVSRRCTTPRVAVRRGASLLTGLNPHQTGIGHMGNNIVGEPSYQGYLNNRCVTIAEVLRDAGYRTGISGKWHCGADPEREEEGHPQLQRGFEQMFWFEGGNGYFNHSRFFIDRTAVEASGTDYLTDMITDHAVRMVDDVQK